MPQNLLPTSLVGSYAQPDWLIDRKKLAGRFPPPVRAKELWRVAPEFLDQAQDDATLLAIRDQERAGLDIITDGEMRRESYSNRFATALEGVDIDNPGTALDRSGHPNPVPRVTGKVRRKHPVQVRDVEFLRKNTDRMIKMTVPGPFTKSQQAQNDFYADEEEMALDYALAVNAEIRDLFAAGADVVQIDEPYMQARPEKARKYGLKALNTALDGATGRTAVHVCFGYAAIIHVRPGGYSFLPELAGSPVQRLRETDCVADDAVSCEPVSAANSLLYLDSTKTREAVVDTGGQVDSGVVDDSPWIFVRSGTRRTDSGRAGWPCGAPGGAAGERDCSFERRLELRGGRVGAFAGRRHGARVVRGLSETGHGGIEEFRP
jgi:5-methyltetrahydropteroyltriglutamate--homocysteine methyltransferase